MKRFFYLLILLELMVGLSACNGQDVAQVPEMSLLDAVKMGDIEIVRQHIDGGTDLNRTFVVEGGDWYGATPLHLAVAHDQENIVGLILDNGADINIRANNLDGASPLAWAAFLGKVRMTKILLNRGADVDALDNHGNNAIESLESSPFVDETTKTKLSFMME